VWLRDPWSPELERAFAGMGADVYGTMNGATEFTITGPLKSVDVTGEPSSPVETAPQRTPRPMASHGAMIAAISTLFDGATRDQTLARIGSLRPDSARAWGKMDAAQMMAHCALGLEAATGDAKLDRSLPARMIGWIFKGWLVGSKPFSRNSPTHPQLVMKSRTTSSASVRASSPS
jgi:hypothetical protein